MVAEEADLETITAITPYATELAPFLAIVSTDHSSAHLEGVAMLAQDPVPRTMGTGGIALPNPAGPPNVRGNHSRRGSPTRSIPCTRWIDTP